MRLAKYRLSHGQSKPGEPEMPTKPQASPLPAIPLAARDTNATPIVRFHRLIGSTRVPIRADRSAGGTLPTRATRYCEAVTSASSFGWWVFPPMNISLLWDGDTIFWQYKNEWLPITTAQFPGFRDAFDATAPADLTGCAPPFLTALPEPGTIQIWTGLIAQTAQDWSLLVRPPANLPLQGGYALYEGIVETDRWFGPLFTNLRLTRTDSPVHLASDFPLIQVQPILRQTYNDKTLASINVTPDIASLTLADWDAYRTTIAEPNSRPNRAFGAYATAVRKRRNDICPAFKAQNLSPRVNPPT